MEMRSGRFRGEMVPDIEVAASERRRVRLADYRGRLNLVLVLAGRGDGADVVQFLDNIARRYAEFKSEDAEVAAILLADREVRAAESGWPFAVLTDTDGRVHRWFEAQDSRGTATPAAFVADRYGEIWAEYRSEQESGLPQPDEILQWLFFINSQCPECGVPDWPR